MLLELLETDKTNGHMDQLILSQSLKDAVTNHAKFDPRHIICQVNMQIQRDNAKLA